MNKESRGVFIKSMDVEILPVRDGRVEIKKFPDRFACGSQAYYTEIDIKKETCFFKRFVSEDSKGFIKEIYISWTDEVAKILDLPLQAYDDMQSEISVLRTEKYKVQERCEDLLKSKNYYVDECYKFTTMNFWQRLRFLFIPVSKK